MAIITATDLKSYLEIIGTGQDTLLGNIATRANSLIQAFLNRNIEAADYTEKHDGGDNFIIVKNPPINSISSLTDNGTAVSTSDYVYYSDSGIVKLKNKYFTNLLQGVEISYNGGFSTVPDVIVEATLEIGAIIYKETDAGEGRLGKGSLSMNQIGSIQINRRISPILMEALKRYRLPRL